MSVRATEEKAIVGETGAAGATWKRMKANETAATGAMTDTRKRMRGAVEPRVVAGIWKTTMSAIAGIAVEATDT